MRSGRENISEPRPSDAIGHGRVARGFTLIELVVTITVITVLMGLSAYAFRTIRSGGGLAQAKDTLVNYVAIARSYAMENHIETMLVVNPYNSRFELWHLNPPKAGGPWDPYSGGNVAPYTDGYAYAPVFDKTVGLPVDSNGRQLYGVFPIDYDDPAYRLTANTDENLDNLTWTAICFDEEGRLVTRTRRIATRSYYLRNGSVRGLGANRLQGDETPNLGLLEPPSSQPLVTSADTAITSTRGFVICDMSRLEHVIPLPPTPNQLIGGLLRETRAGRKYESMAATVMIDRSSGQPLAGDQK